MSEQIRREFILDFPIEKVQKAVEDACRTSAGNYQIKDRNTVFGTYSISLVKMLSVLPVTLQVKKVDENKTAVELSAIAGPSLSRTPYFTSELIEGFLRKVGDFVSGKLIIQPTPSIVSLDRHPPKKSSTIISVIVVLALLAGLLYWVSR